MIQLILSLLVGFVLVVSLYFFARRAKPSAEGTAQQLREARQTLDSLQHGLLPNDLVERIFAREDLEYVLSAAPPDVQSRFLADRKSVALGWVRRVRAAVLALMRFHRGHARLHARLSFSTELRLALNFAGLLTACRLLQVTFYLRGPYAAPGMVRTAAAAAGRVCSISENSLAFLNVKRVDPLESGAARHRA
jgi:hypothetical protein